MKKIEIHNLLIRLTKQAYLEGRTHQFDDDFPDVGMYFEKKFEDTVVYKTIMSTKP